ncbi:MULTISPECIES: HAMP domain-containing sensor histidine kinase [unclassified Clostridium]|jgi:multi-sensor signal transduction histidine kinase|uniref:HAMP domain-containing sensor histidine kinase n=1 Tax=unclassified Clostridium TaxID=2614128 RepID=UPI0025C7300F|nr:HAMP domain-containing sensor histidine kinase [Clostridium sp.]MCI6692718.1 cell wall metabolism sensor histidine kinase WalK [Clostridium sp.]MDY2632065.1 ATP-binding protein [Clostridium sp.]MDY6227124.1 ATP-binding protein [Clostridium sp.]
MKKRIVVSSLITVIFALIVVTSSFIALLNVKEIERTKDILSSYNDMVIRHIKLGDDDLVGFKINNSRVRFTIVDKAGNVIKDSENNNLENHSSREEIIGAFKNGKSTSTRYSRTEGVNVIYYATKIDENTVLRSSVPISNIKFFTEGYIKYYLIIIIFVILLCLGLSLKLIRAIIYPLKELEIVTDKIANGDYSRRVDIHTNDEIGSLANTFNNMADQLNSKIIDSIDKQNKLEAILESMESGVIAVDNKQNVILINPYAQNLLGINKDIIGKNISEYIIDYDIISFMRSIHEIETKEIKLMHPIPRELRIKKSPIINTKKIPIGVVLSILDITDIKRLENIRSQFVANVSHELKTPLTSIKGFAETLKYVEDIETRNKFLDIIDKETERLTNLINDILVLSNIENNKMKEEEFNPSEVIEDVINMFINQVNNKDVEIYFHDKGSNVLLGDRDKFYQMMLNLVENAVKYSNNKAIINIRTYESQYYEYIEVEDNGIGIPKEDLPRIFERFYRVDKSRAKGGTGLGLAIVKHIAKMFNGEVYVESVLNKGTKFTIKLRKIKKLNEL